MELQTRQDFAALLRRMLDPLKPLYSPQKALLQLGDTGVSYPPRTIGMEGFSRPLWGLAPYWMGGGVDEDGIHTFSYTWVVPVNVEDIAALRFGETEIPVE